MAYAVVVIVVAVAAAVLVVTLEAGDFASMLVLRQATVLWW